MAPCSGGARKGFSDHSLIPRGHALPSLSNSFKRREAPMAAFVDRRIPPQGSPFLAEAVLVHDIPGRLRLVAPALKNKPDRIAMLRARLGQLDAVRAIHFNALSGSVIVEYVTRTGARKAALGGAGRSRLPAAKVANMHARRHPRVPRRAGSADGRRPLRAQSRPGERDCGLDLTHNLSRPVATNRRARLLNRVVRTHPFTCANGGAHPREPLVSYRMDNSPVDSLPRLMIRAFGAHCQHRTHALQKPSCPLLNHGKRTPPGVAFV
jgi:hypothetical protein